MVKSYYDMCSFLEIFSPRNMQFFLLAQPQKSIQKIVQKLIQLSFTETRINMTRILLLMIEEN